MIHFQRDYLFLKHGLFLGNKQIKRLFYSFSFFPKLFLQLSFNFSDTENSPSGAILLSLLWCEKCFRTWKGCFRKAFWIPQCDFFPVNCYQSENYLHLLLNLEHKFILCFIQLFFSFRHLRVCKTWSYSFSQEMTKAITMLWRRRGLLYAEWNVFWIQVLASSR